MLLGNIREEYELLGPLQAVSSRTGIIKSVVRPFLTADAPPLQLYISQGPHLHDRTNTLSGIGAKYSQHSALMASLNETLERYSGFTGQKAVSCRGRTAHELRVRGAKVIELDKIKYYTTAQFAEHYGHLLRLSDEKPLDWVETEHLVSGEKILVPADYILFSQHETHYYTESTTSGLAAANNYASALLSATLELVERDAVMYAWWTRTPSPTIDVFNEPEPRLHECLSALRHLKNQIRVVVVDSALGLPVFLATFVGKAAQEPKLCLAAACHLDPVIAVEKCLQELSHMIFWSTHLLRTGFTPPQQNLAFNEEILSFTNAIHYYLAYGGQDVVNILAHAHKRCTLTQFANFSHTDHAKALDNVVARCKAHGIDLYGADITPVDVHACGTVVARAFSPQLIPINSAHKMRPWGHKRLVESGRELNPFPQPFP